MARSRPAVCKLELPRPGGNRSDKENPYGQPHRSLPAHESLPGPAVRRRSFALLRLQVGATIYTTHIGYGYFRDEFYYNHLRTL